MSQPARSLPRVGCPTCGRTVAVRPVKGRAGWWRISVHNHLTNGATCSGSRTDVDVLADDPADNEPEPAELHAVPDIAVAEGTEIDGHQTPNQYAELPETLTGGMTVWGPSAGLQIRPAHCANDVAVAALALAENLQPIDGIYLIDADTARCWRDALNIATARGVL